MYCVMRRYKFDPHSRDEINQKVHHDFVPQISKAAGLVAYYWMDTGTGEGASCSVFEDRASAERSNQMAADFIQQHLAKLIGKPEILIGEVRAHAERQTKAARAA